MRRFAIEGLLLALTLVAYSNSFSSGFVLDSKGLILQDPRVQAATQRNVEDIVQHTYWWPVGESGLYRPFTKLTFLAEFAVLGHGERPEGYHLLNLLLHALNSVLLYRLGRRLMDQRAAAVLAALWAVHPVLTEPVTSIGGRADLLAGACVLGGLLLYLRGIEATRERRWRWWSALFAVSMVGMFSKESAAVLPGVVLLYEFAFPRKERNWKTAAAGLAVIAVPLALMLAQRASVLAAAGHSEFPYTDNPLVGTDFWTARLTALAVAARGLALLAWPAQLSADYSYNQIPLVRETWRAWLCWLGAAAALAGVALCWRRSRPMFFLAGFALITYLPSSNLLYLIGSIMAERFLYLPAIGVVGCLVYALRRWRYLPVAAGVVVVVLGARTWLRNEDWRDDLSITQANAAAAPQSFKSHEALAVALHEARMLDEAIAEYEKSLKILEGVPASLSNGEPYLIAGRYLMEKGDFARARDVLVRGDAVVQATARAQNVGLPTRFAPLYRLLAAAELRLDQPKDSLRHALYARELAPVEAETYMQLAESYWALGDGDHTAITLLQGTLLAPNVALRNAALEFYSGSGIDTQGCAVSLTPGGRGLNPQCGLVHRHMCAAAAEAIQLQTRQGRMDIAAQIRGMARTSIGCTEGLP